MNIKSTILVIDYLVLNDNVTSVRLKATTNCEVEPLYYVMEIPRDLESDIKTNPLAEINRRVDFKIVD
jgi:hypothetical protein